MDNISQPIDYLGINYYTKETVKGILKNGSVLVKGIDHKPDPFYSTMWEFYPKGLEEVIEEIWKKYRPQQLMILENGCAIEDKLSATNQIMDEGRIAYLQEHIKCVHNLIQRSIPITGYFVWSFIDNFEWAFGYDKRFGLVYIDFATQKRIVKASGWWYRDWIKEVFNNKLENSFKLD